MQDIGESKLVKWTTARKGLPMPCPTIIGNRQSEAIEVLLQRLDTYSHRLWDAGCNPRMLWDDDYKKRQQAQWPRRNTKIALLESGRHLLVAIQYFLYFLFCREQLKGNCQHQSPLRVNHRSTPCTH